MTFSDTRTRRNQCTSHPTPSLNASRGFVLVLFGVAQVKGLRSRDAAWLGLGQGTHTHTCYFCHMQGALSMCDRQPHPLTQILAPQSCG